MRTALFAATIAAAGLLSLTALAAGTSSSGSSSSATGQGQTGTTGQMNSTTGQAGTSGQTGTMGQAGTSGAAGMSGESSAWNNARPIEDADIGSLAGRTVTSSDGEEIGRIDSVVTGGDGQNYAVMDVGSFLAIGEKSVAVPLEQLRQGDDDALLMSPEGEQNLGTQSDYRAEQYQPFQSGGMSGAQGRRQ